MTDEREPTCRWKREFTQYLEAVCAQRGIEMRDADTYENYLLAMASAIALDDIEKKAELDAALAAARRVPSAPDAGPEPSEGPLTTEHQKLMDYAVARGWPISPEGVFGLCAYYDQLRRENPVRAARPAPSEVEIVKALERMMESHGMHGPCKHNSCSDCRDAYAKARAALALKAKEGA